jgi:hypothetical protein
MLWYNSRMLNHNKTYNKLTVIQSLGKSKDGHRLWECVCECGKKRIDYASKIRTGKVKNCKDCARNDAANKIKTHGMKYSLEYNSWTCMKDRCLNPKSKDYARYGGKGITIYKEWINSFEKFYEYIGKKEKGQSIDRIDNTKGYEPGNVRWANNSQQQRNKQNSLWLLWNNKKTHINDIAKDLGISRGAACLRWKRGKLHGAEAITKNC